LQKHEEGGKKEKRLERRKRKNSQTQQALDGREGAINLEDLQGGWSN